MKATLARRRVRLLAPFEAAHGIVRERDLITLSLSDGDGVTGHGEAAPLPGYEGPDAARVLAALRAYLPLLARATTGADLLDACRGADPLPQALAAVDLALWDLAGRRAGVPVAALLHPAPAPAVTVNATIASLDRAGAAAAAAQAAREGFQCVKVKVGVGDDAGRVAAVRAAAGRAMALRLDANGAWEEDEAVRAIEALAPAGLELVEEPCHGLAAIAAVRARVSVRIAMDETAALPGALGAGAADAVCLKISRCGGITGVLAAAQLVRAAGAEPYVASTLDGPLGIAAGLHAAAALAGAAAIAPCGLATLGMLEGAGTQLAARAGAITLPAGPGLGVSLAFYAGQSGAVDLDVGAEE